MGTGTAGYNTDLSKRYNGKLYLKVRFYHLMKTKGYVS